MVGPRVALTWLGIAGCLGCGDASEQRPPSRAPASSANTAFPTAPSPPDAKPVEPTVWTTPSESDTCTEYVRRVAPAFSQFETKQQCEEWVKQRRCKPGLSCYDGCNRVSCDGTGMRMLSTLKRCMVVVSGDIEFRAKTTEPTTEPEWDEVAHRIERVFRVPERVLKITAYAKPDEAPSQPARQRLAQRRLALIKKELTARGVDPKRLTFIVGDPAQHGFQAIDAGRVVLQVDPNRTQPEDFDPSHPNYRELCAVKYAKDAQGGSGGQ